MRKTVRKKVKKKAVKKPARKRAACSKDRAADLRLRREYTVSLEEHGKLFKFQDESCAICKRPVQAGKARLAVDHCHTTGLIRGLLCWTCNRNIARFQDNADRLLAASEYIRNPPATKLFGAARFTAPGRVGTKKRAKLLLAMKGNA